MYRNTLTLANTVLELGFAVKEPINAMRLQRILYVAHAIQLQQRGEPLLADNFATWAYGPCNIHLYEKCHSLKGKPLTRYLVDASNQKEVYTKGLLSINLAWAATRRINTVPLANLLRQPGSAWDKAFQAEKTYLSNHDIAADNTFLPQLGISQQRL